jgi:hypothetical protein
MSNGRSIPFRRHLPARLTGIAGVLVAATMLAAAPLQAATPTSYGVNLVKNAGAENGLKSWDTFLAFKTHKYGPSGFGLPSTHASQQIGGGTRFFYSGDYDNAYSQCPEADQTIKLNGIGSAIDNGHVKVFLSAYAGTSGAPDIHAHVDLYFRNSSNHSVSGSDFQKQAISTNEKYKLLTASKVLKPGTRTLRVHLYADGSDTATGGCYAFWDKVSVIVKHV